MKINSEYSNTNLFEIAKKRKAEEQSKSEPKTFKSQNPVQVDISKEAMDKYRAEFQENASAESDEKIHWLNTEDYTMKCVRINGKDENGNALSVKERAQTLLEDYASKYQQLEKGYDDGTIKIYSEDDENRVLTKEEALQKLTDSFESHAKTMEEMAKQQEKAAKIIEESIRNSPAWKNSSQRAKQFLSEQDEKRENPEYQPEHFSENIIKAGATFRAMFFNGTQTGNSSIQDIISKISLW